MPRWAVISAGAVALLAGLVAVGEASGWPFLIGPLQSRLAAAAERRIVVGDAPQERGRARIGLIGSVRLDAPAVEIGAPAWSEAPHMVRARDVHLRLSYTDLWRVYRGGPLRIHELRASELDARLQRRKDGSATWQFGAPKPDRGEQDSAFPSFGELRVADGRLAYADAILDLDVDAAFALREGAAVGSGRPASGSAPGAPPVASQAAASSADTGAVPEQKRGLEVHAEGTYKRMPLKVDLFTSGVLDLAGADTQTLTQPIRIDARVGRARLHFTGEADDPLRMRGLRGHFEVEGRSLADIGEPFGLTLPTTGPFKTVGELAKEGSVWKAEFGPTVVGESRLRGNFTLDRRPAVPLLTGRLAGEKLLLADLAPSVGAPPKASGAMEKKPASSRPGRVFPDKAFDLPSLREMDADVQVDIAHVDLGASILEPLRPLKGQLALRGGVLKLSDLDARTADGRLTGALQLDGSKDPARWTANLRLLNVRLERWLRFERGGKAPSYLSGRMNAGVQVAGAGRSTAEILGSLDGSLRVHIQDGTISHLVIEGLGLDAAQALGVMIKGDASLPVNCNVIDLAIAQGVVTPRVFILDTPDSAIWVDGSMSLRSEALDLRAVISPKDFSLFSLRTPVHIDGTLAKPKVSLETGRLAGKAGAAALLALINPIAAVLPFVDTGDSEEARKEAARCVAMARGKLPGQPAAREAGRR